MKYLPGKDMPCDFGSRHPPPINHLTDTQKEKADHDNIQDLSFTMKYLPGEDMPCDFGSRHPPPIDYLTDTLQTNLY